MKLFTYWRSLATYRVRIALALKNIEVEPIYIDLLKGHQAQPEFKTLNPMMAVPLLIEDDGTPLTQSLAIMEYLDERYSEPPLLPADARGRARVRALSQITVADSHPLNVPRVRHHLAQTFGATPEQIGAWGRHWLSLGLDAYEGQLTRAVTVEQLRAFLTSVVMRKASAQPGRRFLKGFFTPAAGDGRNGN